MKTSTLTYSLAHDHHHHRDYMTQNWYVTAFSVFLLLSILRSSSIVGSFDDDDEDDYDGGGGGGGCGDGSGSWWYI